MGVLEERSKARQTAILSAKRWASRLEGDITAILIGSFARGDFNVWSDIDILLIGKFEGKPPHRTRDLNVPVGYEVTAFTPSEFKTQLVKRNPLVIEAMRQGVILRDDLAISHPSRRQN